MNRFKTAIMMTTLLVGLVGVAQTPAMAQEGPRYHDRYDRDRDHGRDRRPDRREERRYDVERAPRRVEVVREYDRRVPYVPTWRLGRYDRVYRGYDDRYYCRRSDGTTGLIIGGITGGVLGNIIAPGDSKALGTILGAAGGAIVGHSIDRNNVVCR